MFTSLIKGKKPPPRVTPETNRQPKRLGSILQIQEKDVNDVYKIGKPIGSGKFATTYLCKEKSSGKKYACKSIQKTRLVTAGEKEDIRREVRIMKNLKGLKNVVELIDTFEDRKCVHLVMEYCEGGELYEKMESKGKCRCIFSEKIAAQIFSSIMKVVYSLHFMGVMHRDLKPENFLLSKKGVLGFIPCFTDYTRLKAIDFGLSAYTDEGIFCFVSEY